MRGGPAAVWSGCDGRVPGHPAGDDDVDPAQQGGGAGGAGLLAGEPVSCSRVVRWANRAAITGLLGSAAQTARQAATPRASARRRWRSCHGSRRRRCRAGTGRVLDQRPRTRKPGRGRRSAGQGTARAAHRAELVSAADAYATRRGEPKSSSTRTMRALKRHAAGCSRSCSRRVAQGEVRPQYRGHRGGARPRPRISQGRRRPRRTDGREARDGPHRQRGQAHGMNARR